MTGLMKLEEAGKLALGLYFCQFSGTEVWLICLLLFLPDLSLAAFAVGFNAGVRCYNLVHHQGLAMGLLISGLAAEYPLLILTGGLLLAHSSFARMLGMGLRTLNSGRA